MVAIPATVCPGIYLKRLRKQVYLTGEFSRNFSLRRQQLQATADPEFPISFETIGKQYQQLPSFMKKTAYNNPTNEIDTVFQQAFNTTQHQFEWFSSHQEALQYFNDYMALRRDSNVSWLSAYPVEAEIGSLDPSRAVYVNIGGGIGHQCAQFRERFPALPGKVILQDLPHSIAQALQTSGVENMEHNFFEPQPVKGESTLRSVRPQDLAVRLLYVMSMFYSAIDYSEIPQPRVFTSQLIS